MPRTYSFDHFTAKPAVSPWKRASAQEKQSFSKGGHGAVHYGHAHSRTEELYKQHREEHDRQEAMRGPSGVSEEPRGARDTSPQASEEVLEGSDGFTRERLKGMAQSAVGSVMQAAREAVRGRPLVGARKLAGEAVSGALRVAREVSARKSRSTQDTSTRRKGPGKKR